MHVESFVVLTCTCDYNVNFNLGLSSMQMLP